MVKTIKQEYYKTIWTIVIISLLLCLVTGTLNSLYRPSGSLGTTQVRKRNARVKYETCLMLLRHQNNVNGVILVSLLLTLARYHTKFSSVYFC